MNELAAFEFVLCATQCCVNIVYICTFDFIFHISHISHIPFISAAHKNESSNDVFKSLG